MSIGSTWAEQVLDGLLAHATRAEDETAWRCVLAEGILPTPIRVVALVKAAHCATAAHKYRQARKYLIEASRLQPYNARLYWHLGHAFEQDPRGCRARAERCYRKATRLNSNEPQFKASLGLAQVRIGEVAAGVRALCKAAEAAQFQIDVLSVVLDGLREAGEAELALQYCNRAKFLAPKCPRLHQLQLRAQFDCAVAKQGNTSRPSSKPRIKLYQSVDKPQATVPQLPNGFRHDAGMAKPVSHIRALRAYRSE